MWDSEGRRHTEASWKQQQKKGIGSRGKVQENHLPESFWKARKNFVILCDPLEVMKNMFFPLSFSSKLIFFGRVPDRWQCQTLELFSDHGAVVLLPFCFESLNVKYMSYASFAVKSILFWYLINDHFDHLWQVAKNLSSLPFFFFLTASVWEKQIRFKKNISICHIY